MNELFALSFQTIVPKDFDWVQPVMKSVRPETDFYVIYRLATESFNWPLFIGDNVIGDLLLPIDLEM